MKKKLGLSNKGLSSADFARELRDHDKGSYDEVAARGNKISSVPDELAQFSCLVTLRLNQNLLTALPSWFGQKLSLLTGLDLSNNQLAEFGDSLCSLTLLHTLHLRQNTLKKVSRKCIDLSKNLSVLSLSQNADLGEFAKDVSSSTEVQHLLQQLSVTEFPRTKASPRRDPLVSPRSVELEKAKQLAQEQQKKERLALEKERDLRLKEEAELKFKGESENIFIWSLKFSFEQKKDIS